MLRALAYSTHVLCLLTLVCVCARAQRAGVKNRLLKRVIAGTEWEPASEVATGTNNMWIIINDGASALPDFPKQTGQGWRVKRSVRAASLMREEALHQGAAMSFRVVGMAA